MRIQSALIGAAVAALVILPAYAADSGWVTGQWKTYDARNLKLEDMVGMVRVDVKDSGPMAIQISGAPERVNAVHLNQRGNTLVVGNEISGRVWDWRHWFDFRVRNNSANQLQIHIAVPRGAGVDAEVMAGNMTMGNTNGPLKFSIAGHTESTIGDVTKADIDVAGSGKLVIGNVAGDVKIDDAGSGNVRIASAGKVDADIAGSGSINVGDIRGGADIDIAGSGDFSAASVNGMANASIAGSGSVTIAGGTADPLKVEIMGSGNVSFGGVAVNPKIEAMGSGSVKIKSYRGTLQNEGAKIAIGG